MSFLKFMHGPLISLGSKKEIILKSFILQSSLMIQYLSALIEFILLTLNIEANLFYAIEFETDSKRGIFEYFDENGKNLRRAFFKITCSV